MTEKNKMLFYNKKLINGCSLAIWKIDESVEQLLSHFSTYKEAMTTQIASMKSEKRQKEFLSVRILISKLLGSENNVVYNNNGRPSLLNREEKISISHTQGYASVIIHPNRTVGVDIEQCREKIFRVKHKFLSAYELAHVDLQEELKYLTLLWSAKETLYKISENHLVEFDEDMEIEPLTLSSCGLLYITDKKVGKRYELSYQFFDDFVIVYGAE